MADGRITQLEMIKKIAENTEIAQETGHQHRQV
jgi:hypothetical protein